MQAGRVEYCSLANRMYNTVTRICRHRVNEKSWYYFVEIDFASISMTFSR